MEDELDDAGAVAQVDEDQAAVVAAAVNPAGHPHRRSRRGRPAPGRTRCRGTRWRAVRAASLTPRLRRAPRRACARSIGRCSPLCMSRSCAEPSASRISTRRAPIRSACLSWPLSPRPARSTSAERPAWRSSLASASARRRWLVVGDGDEGVAAQAPPRPRRAPAGSARSRPPSRPPASAGRRAARSARRSGRRRRPPTGRRARRRRRRRSSACSSRGRGPGSGRSS